ATTMRLFAGLVVGPCKFPEIYVKSVLAQRQSEGRRADSKSVVVVFFPLRTASTEPLRVAPRESGTIIWLNDGNDCVLPSGASANSTMLVGPSRGTSQTLPVAEQCRDGIFQVGRHVRFGEPGNDTVTEAAPSARGRRCPENC